MRKACGLTLVELVVTIAVAALLIAVAVPSFVSMVASWRLSNAANDLVASIHATRSKAIRLNRDADLCRAANDAATACAGGGNAHWQQWILVSGNSVIRREAISTPDAILVSSDFAGDALVYQPSGLPAASGSFTLCSIANINQNVRTINVGPGNRVSVERASGDCS